MSPTQITQIIQNELLAEPDHTNVFGLDLTKCLIQPIQQTYINANDQTDQYLLWTVLEETEDHTGYTIYYDEETKMFGLGMWSKKDELLDIGSYGSFLKTLYSM